MKGFKHVFKQRFAILVIALVAAVSVIDISSMGLSTAFAQRGPGDGRGPRRPGPRPPMHEDYFGTTGLISKTRTERHEIYVGAHRGQYISLRFIAKDDAVDIKNAWILFGRGRMRIRPINLGENRQLFVDLNRWRYIDRIVLDVQSSDVFGSKGQIEVYGRQ